MANLKPNEVRITHPKAERPLIVLRDAFDAGRYPGWVEDRPSKPKGRKRKPAPEVEVSDTEAVATDEKES